APESAALDCRRDSAVLIHALERVDFRKRGDRARSLPRGRDDGVDRLAENKRTRRIVDHDDARFDGQIVEAAAHRRATLRASNANQQPAQVALEDPRWWIASVRFREHGNYHTDVGAFLEQLHAVQQHRLACHPAKLFQLARPGARSGSTSDDHHPDVLKRFRHENSRLNISAIVATPIAFTSLGTRPLADRCATNAFRIPILAASARRRSVCATGRISPPSPTSPMNTASDGNARSYTLDASAAATARSPAGSRNCTPPTTFMNTSSEENDSPARLSRTASSSASLRPS